MSWTAVSRRPSAPVPGATPAGDDVICGVLAGLDLLGHAGAHARLGAAVAPLSGVHHAHLHGTCWRPPQRAATPSG